MSVFLKNCGLAPGYKAGPAVQKALDPVLVFIRGNKIYLSLWSVDIYGSFEPDK